jgi:hypothetical protein
MNKRLSILTVISMFIALPVFAGVDFNVGDAKATLGASIWVEAGWDYQFHGDVPTSVTSDKETQQYINIDDPTNINLKVNYKQLEGYIEIRHDENASELELYSAWGAYNFNDRHSILFGKAPIVFSKMSPKQNLYNANCLDGYGGLDPWKRSYQVRYSYKSAKLNFDAALDEVKIDEMITDDNYQVNGVPGGDDYQLQNYFPALALNLEIMPSDAIMINPSVYVQDYKLKPSGSTDSVYQEILTYAFSLGLEFNVKPVNIQLEGWWGQNIGMLDGIDARPAFFDPITIDDVEYYMTPMGTPQWNDVNTNLHNVTTYGGWLQVEVPVKMLTPRIGGGYQTSSTGLVQDGYLRNVYTWGAFINCDIKIKEYLNICPEYLFMYNGNDADKNFLGTNYNNLGNEQIGGVTMILTF